LNIDPLIIDELEDSEAPTAETWKEKRKIIGLTVEEGDHLFHANNDHISQSHEGADHEEYSNRKIHHITYSLYVR